MIRVAERECTDGLKEKLNESGEIRSQLLGLIVANRGKRQLQEVIDKLSTSGFVLSIFSLNLIGIAAFTLVPPVLKSD